jgi:hypothetical protein
MSDMPAKIRLRVFIVLQYPLNTGLSISKYAKTTNPPLQLRDDWEQYLFIDLNNLMSDV